MRTWFMVMQAAEYAGVCRDTIYSTRERREICHLRVGGRRATCLTLDSIDACVERHAVNTHDRRMVGQKAVSQDGWAEARS